MKNSLILILALFLTGCAIGKPIYVQDKIAYKYENNWFKLFNGMRVKVYDSLYHAHNVGDSIKFLLQPRISLRNNDNRR